MLALIKRQHLSGRGIGLIDLHLLASTLLTPETRLWTLDRRLARLAHEFAVAYRPDDRPRQRGRLDHRSRDAQPDSLWNDHVFQMDKFNYSLIETEKHTSKRS